MSKCIEQQIFTWEQWDLGCDDGDKIFYKVKLVVPVGDYPVGTEFYSAEFRASNSTLTFYNEDKQEEDLVEQGTYKLIVSVQEF